MKRTLDIGELHRTLPSQEALLALLAFEKEGDLTKAARSLQLTQPALSFQLKKLEDSLGFQIFSHAGKRKVLTKLGQKYVEEIKTSFISLHLAHEQISRLSQDLDHQKIRVGGRRELFIPFLSFPFPGQIEFIQSPSSDALQALREHRLDIAISGRSVDSADLMAKVFFESSFKVITPKSWKLGKNAHEELRTRPVIVYGNHHAYLDDYLSWRGWRFQELNVSRIVEDWFSVVELVRYGLGWAIIPEAWELHTNAVVEEGLQVESFPRQKIYLFLRRDDRKTPWVTKLDEWLAERKGV